MGVSFQYSSTTCDKVRAHAIPPVAPAGPLANTPSMKNLFLIATFGIVAACGGTTLAPPPSNRPPVPVAAQDTCNAAQYTSLIGQDATALERVMILGLVRVIRPGQAVTMDLRPERINFNVSANNRITSITCS
jgi:hypothetical protein